MVDTNRALVPVPTPEMIKKEYGDFLRVYNPQATPEELTHFAVTCMTYRISPMRKQIYLVSRWDTAKKRMVATPQISIGGLRVLALRSNQFEGTTEPQWGDEDGNWHSCWPKKLGKHPYAARIGVYRRGFRAPVWGVVYFAEVAQKTKEGNLTRFWEESGLHMAIKCAEADGLRKAFEEQCGGIYIHEEMNQADTDTPVISIVPAPSVQERQAEPALAETARVIVTEEKTPEPEITATAPRSATPTSAPRPAAQAPASNTQPPAGAPDLADIPTVGRLRARVDNGTYKRDGKTLEWKDVLAEVFQTEIAAKRTTVERLLKADFGPESCQRINTYLTHIKAA